MKYNPNDLESIVSYMRSKGLYVKNDNSKVKIGNAYAIFGSKAMIRIRKAAEDGINGIVLYLASDKEDLDRITNLLNKEVYKNGESTRPYKVRINENEIDRLTDILLMNKNNISK